MKNKFWIMTLIFIMSCTRNNKQIESNEIEDNVIVDEISLNQETVNFWDNYDWLIEFNWSLDDGRRLVDPSAIPFDWIGDMTPIVRIYKFEIPQESDLYQVRLRNDLFYFVFQTEEKDKLFPIGNAFGTEVFELIFNENFTSRTLNRDGYFFTHGDRIGEQINPDYPLVGIWGKLHSLSEYRLINSVDCSYYMEIDKEIPGFAIRKGTYLLKQTGDKEFETISSFPDGYMKLEFEDKTRVIITPLFTLPDEEGWVAPLIMTCNPKIPRFNTEAEY